MNVGANSLPERRKRSLPKESEDELALCLQAKARWGFESTRDEVRDFVREYISNNKGTDTELGRYLDIHCKFKDDKPGKDWLISFMKRYSLSTKKPSKLEKTSKIVASDLEIFSYFDLLVEEIERLNLGDRPGCVWNLGETNVSIDAKSTKIVATVGKKGARKSATSGRDNHTVMAAVSADGDLHPPLIVFKDYYIIPRGYYTQYPGYTAEYPGTEVAVSENGWTPLIFFGWLEQFCKTITERPLLLIYDGHSSHLTYEVIKLAREEMVSIIKLPPHTTDRLQPLDVSCFKHFKTIWAKTLHRWTYQNLGQKIQKSEFICLLGSIWRESFTVENIVAGFKKSGMFPPNRVVYPVDAFNPKILHAYTLFKEEMDIQASVIKAESTD